MKYRHRMFDPMHGLIATFFFFAASCTFADGIRGHDKNILSIRIRDEPETLDWNKAQTQVETYLLMNLMEGLASYDGKMRVAPALAKEWSISDDERVYTFKLRRDVKWSDGVPLKAADFLYSWKRLLSPATASPYAYLLFDIENAEAFHKGIISDFSAVGIKALDDFTLKVKLVRAVAHWIHIPTFWVTFPLREDVIQKHGFSWDSPGRMVTLGPYLLSSRDIGIKVSLRSNPLYYGKKGNIDEVNAVIIKDDAVALRMYDEGKLDFLADLSSLDLSRIIKARASGDFRVFPYLKTQYLAFVVNKYPSSSLRLRRAVAMAVDKNAIIDSLKGGQVAAASFVPPGLFAHARDIGLPYDPSLARSELRASGLDLSVGIKLEVLLPNWDRSLIVARAIQEQLKKNLKLDVLLQPFENKSFRSKLGMQMFPLFHLGWGADYPDPDSFMSVFLSSSGTNYSGWKNEKYDELVLAARNGPARDVKKRSRLYFEAQKILIEEQAVVVPLYYEHNHALIKPHVKGIELNPLNYLILRDVRIVNPSR